LNALDRQQGKREGVENAAVLLYDSNAFAQAARQFGVRHFQIGAIRRFDHGL
jgi:hypothetical protein